MISSALPACPARFRGLFKQKKEDIADSRVQKAIVWLVASNGSLQLTKQGHPFYRSVHALKQRQYGLLQAIPGCIISDVVNRTFGIRIQSLDWLRLGSVIELNRTHKNVPVPFVRNQWNDCVRLVFGSVRGLTTPG